MTKVWRKSIDRYWRYHRNIQSRTHGQTDGPTDKWTEARTKACKTYSLQCLLCRRRRLRKSDKHLCKCQ